MRSPRVITYQLLVILVGWGWLLAAWRGAAQPWGTLFLFALTSLLVRRAGFPVAQQLTHSLANVINVAALLLLGPVGGALVAAVTSVAHFILSGLLRRQLTERALLRFPLFDGAIKAIMALASGLLYERLGGPFAPTTLSVEMILPLVALSLTWFALDYLLWTLLFFVDGGARHAGHFLRSVARVSAWIELAPLVFSLLLTVGWLLFDAPLRLLLLLNFVIVAVIVQGFAATLRALNRRVATVSLLNQFGQALVEAQHDEPRIGTLLHEYATDLLPETSFELYLLDRDGQLVPPADQPIGAAALMPTILPMLRERPRGRLLGTLGAESLAEEAARPAEERPERGSVLLMPLVSGDQLLGIFVAQSDRLDGLTLDDGRSLAVLATQAAVTMQNAKHFRREQIRSRQLRCVATVSHLVASALSLDDVLWQVADVVRDTFGLYYVQIFLVEPETNEVVFRAGSGPAGRALAESPRRLRIGEEGIVGWVAGHGEPLVVEDVSRDPRYVHDSPLLLPDTRAEVALPLKMESRVLGVLDVQSDHVVSPDSEALQTLQTLADQIAIAIEDARLYVAQREAAWVTTGLLQTAEALNPLVDIHELAATLVRIVPGLAGARAAALYLWEEPRWRFRSLAAQGFESAPPTLAPTIPLLEAAREPGATLLLGQAEPPLPALPAHPLVALPLSAHGGFVGALFLAMPPGAGAVSDRQRPLFLGIASQAAAALQASLLHASQRDEALENERKTQELVVARQVQSSLLPERAPELPGYDVAAYWRPAREVAGDFYDFVRMSQGRAALSVVDVADKGLGAALFMVLARAVLRESIWSEEAAGAALTRTNAMLAADARDGMFLTLFLALLRPESGELEYANAGHLPPLLYHAASDSISSIAPRQLPLAILEDVEYEGHICALEPGDMLVLYTDGITDVFSPSGEPFGMTRLARLVYEKRQRTARGMVNAILEGAVAHGARGPFLDDMTMLVIKRDKA